VWESVDLRELRVFLTLAEELHFGRTAERLSLTPSRVSQLLRALESKLGGKLVHRTSRRVELTAFGERFHSEVEAVHAQLADVLERTQAASRSLNGTLRLFPFSGPSAGPHLVTIVKAFESRYPECSVQLDQLDQDDVFAQLRRGEADLITTWLPIDAPDIVIGPIVNEEPRVLAVGENHPLAGRREVTLEDIADYRVARLGRLPPELQGTWIPSRTPTGRVIRNTTVGMPSRHLAELTAGILRGDFVHATVPSVELHLGPGIVYVPIADLPRWRSALAWRRPATDPRVREFIRIAREVLRKARRPA
jgi:DNA-binding transcriptional LysR family regulator